MFTAALFIAAKIWNHHRYPLVDEWIKKMFMYTPKCCCCWVAKLCPTLCDPVDSSTPGPPVLPLSPRACSNSCPLSWWCLSHPWSPSSSPALSLSQDSDLFQWVSSLHQVQKLELHLQHQSLQWMFRFDFFQDWLVWSPCSPRDSQEASSAPQFKSINSSVLSLLYCPTFTYIFSHKKEGNVAMCNNLDGNWGQDAKQNKSKTETAWSVFCVESKEILKLMEAESRQQMWLRRRAGDGQRDESSQRLWTSSYKMSRFWGCHVKCGDYS